MLNFRESVIVALLANPQQWFPKFESLNDAAEYIGLEKPQNQADIIKLGESLIAVLAIETADKIVEAAEK